MVSLTLFTLSVAYLIGCQREVSGHSSGLLDLLSSITQKRSENKQPVVIILSQDILQQRTRQTPRPQLLDEDLYNVLHVALDTHQFKKQSRRPKYSLKGLYRSKDEQKQEGQVFRSPIVKSLLRISNSLRCEVQDQCQNLCQDKYKGAKKNKCEVACEKTYECQTDKENKEEEYVDPCDDDQCRDSCNGSDDCQQGSTRGEKLVTQKTPCYRC